jgi:hypothetical protein
MGNDPNKWDVQAFDEDGKGPGLSGRVFPVQRNSIPINLPFFILSNSDDRPVNPIIALTLRKDNIHDGLELWSQKFQDVVSRYIRIFPDGKIKKRKRTSSPA